MTFYVRLPRAVDPSKERVLVAMQGFASGEAPARDAPSIRVAGHNPGGGFGYPAGTLTGIAAVDEVVALSQATNAAAIRSRVVERDGSRLSGDPVLGIATWQCAPYILADPGSNQIFEYPRGLVYAVFRIPTDGGLPLRYQDAAYGIAWYDGGAGMPLGGLTLVTASGQIVGTEIRCGTTPGYHVHNFTDFILPPFDGPAPSPDATPVPPSAGDTAVQDRGLSHWPLGVAGMVLLALGVAAGLATGARPRTRS